MAVTAMSVGGIADPPEKTLAERIYNQLRRDILVGSLEPGRKLRFEYLRERYEAGMSTFRESLARLAADGLVIAEGQRGFRVAAVSLADLWDVTRLRQKMETLALQRAIEIGDDGWEAEIVAAYHRLSKLKDPRSGRLTLLGEEPLLRHRAFHFSLIAACNSPWTMRFVSTLYDHSERYRRFSTLRASAPRDTDGEHQALMQAALGRDAKTATRLLVDHLEQTARVVTSLSASWDPAER